MAMSNGFEVHLRQEPNKSQSSFGNHHLQCPEITTFNGSSLSEVRVKSKLKVVFRVRSAGGAHSVSMS